MALYAVLKSGAAYIPVDPEYPPERIQYMLDDSAPVCVITTEALASLVPASAQLLLLDSDATSGESGRFPEAEAWPVGGREPLMPSHPAYVIYTSGSTGRPKGVVVEHSSVVDYVRWAAASYPGVEGETVLHSPVSFDLTITALFTPMTVGGTVKVATLDELAGRGESADGYCDFLKVTPSHLALLDALPKMVRAGGSLVIGGEQLTADQLDTWRRENPSVHVFNEYGPTEATVGCALFRLSPDAEVPPGPIPIGRPAWNTALYILDSRFEPVPAGEEGELYIAGAGLARGYLGRPELTAERFVAHPFGPPGSRMYRTGDLVRLRGDGELEFIGRFDDQTKVNGFRIETAEVESALCALPWVARAAVVARKNHLGDGYLAAFVVPTKSPEHNPPDPADIKSSLATRLPQYMVPARIETVDSFPLTPNGKLDRAALLAQSVGEHVTTSVSDDDPLGSAWAEILGGLPPDEDMGFLEAGGQSLTAARLIAVIERRWGIRLRLATFLREDTSLATLRTLVRTDCVEAQPPAGPGIHHQPALSAQQRRLWIHQQVFPDSPAYNVVGLLETDGPLDAAALQRAWAWLVARHEVLRTTVNVDAAGVAVSRVHEMSALPPAATRLILASHAGSDWRKAVQTFASDSAWQVFRAQELPRALLGLLLDTSGSGRSAVLLSADHMASDQQSLDLLFAGLAARYRAECDGVNTEEEKLPEPPQYSAVMAAQSPQPLQRARELTYWRETLKDAAPELNLSFQHSRPAVPTFRGASVEQELGANVSALLQQKAAEWRVTPAVVFLTCYARVLADWAGVEDVTIGVPVSGRESEEEHHTVGFFMRTLPVRLGIPGGAVAKDLLDPVADALLSAIEHGSLPFDELVEELDLPRDASRNPLFQVWFNDLTQAAPPTTFGAHSATAIEPPTPWSLFDAGLYVHRAANGGYKLQLVHALDLWPTSAAQEFLKQCAGELAQLVGSPARQTVVEPVADDPPTVEHGAVRTCTDLVADVLDHGRRRPELVAIRTADRSISYAELAGRIKRVAGLITSATRDTTPDRPVAVHATRHPDLATVILASWFAGRPVLLLDPSYPDQWTDDASSSAGAVLHICLDATDVVSSRQTPVLAISSDMPAAPEMDTDEMAAMPVGTVGHLLMTSGTTGTPDVVALPSEALPEALGWYADHLDLGPNDVFCLTAPPAHDPVFRDLLLPLILGAAVHVPRDAELHPTNLPELFAQTGTTVWHTTATRARLVTGATSGRADLGRMRRIVFHGEPLREADAEAAARLCHRAEIYNLYGATETPQASALGRWAGTRPTGPSAPSDTVAVADIVPHRSLSIRTARGEAGVGVPGELVVRGRGLALEYRGSSRRRPPQAAPGTALDRIYPTGDLAYRTPDEGIVLLGRIDRQVGVHGHRVELPGIERVLAAQPGVTDCLVTVDPEAADRILAWYVSTRNYTEEGLRQALRARLPQWAIPALFTPVDQLPVTANGKADVRALMRLRTALPTPPPIEHETVAELASLIALRAGELAQERSGRSTKAHADSSFFELGLNSLDLVQLHQRLASDGVDFAIADIFRFPTARMLADHISGRGRSKELQPRTQDATRKSDLAARRNARARLPVRQSPPAGARPTSAKHISQVRNRKE